MSSQSSSQLTPPKGRSLAVFVKSAFLRNPEWPPKATDLSGKTLLLTGANAGLGSHACRQFLTLKLSRLIMAVRSLDKGESVASQLRKDFPHARIDVWVLDMGSYASVQAFARRVASELTRLDVAVLNAGVMNMDFQVNASTGHEEMMQVNFLSTHLLAILLLPALKAKSTPGSPGRLTIVNSGTSYMAKFPNRHQIPLLKSFDNLEIQPWDPSDRYPCSKLVGQLFFTKLFVYVDPKDVIVNMVDPGFCKGTALHRTTHGIVAAAFSLAKTLMGRSLEMGASTYVDAAVVKGEETHGCYVMDWEVRP